MNAVSLSRQHCVFEQNASFIRLSLMVVRVLKLLMAMEVLVVVTSGSASWRQTSRLGSIA